MYEDFYSLNFTNRKNKTKRGSKKYYAITCETYENRKILNMMKKNYRTNWMVNAKLH